MSLKLKKGLGSLAALTRLGNTSGKGGVAEPPTRLTLNGQTITLNSQPVTKAA